MNADTIKIIKRGCETRNRDLINFPNVLEFGINVPLLYDYKFLNSYKLLTTSGFNKEAPNAPLNQTIGNEVSEKAHFDFDGLRIMNGFFGVSTKTGYKELYSVRPTYNNTSKTTPISSLDTSKDVDDNANPIMFGMNDGDNIVVARQPQGIVELAPVAPGNPVKDVIGTNYVNSCLSNQTGSSFTIRNPRLVNIHDHTTTMFGNFDQDDECYLVFPTTAAGSIDPLFLYRFSFYFRINGEMIITPVIQYFTNDGVHLETVERDSRSYIGTAVEATDLSFFDLLIPDVSKGQFINERSNRMRIILKFEATTECKLEIAYPVLEHSYNLSPAVSVIIPEVPSGLNPNEVHSSKLTQGWTGRNITFDSSRLFFGHLGRKLFDAAISYSLKDSNIVSELRMLENFNERGDTIVLRPKHHDMPPVLFGDIKITNTNTFFNYHYNEIRINFTETE